MYNIESFWRSTGYKFEGTEQDWEETYTGCDKQMPWSDEEGYFSKFLCVVDMKICDKQCLKHHVKLNSDIEEFVVSLNKNLEQK